MSHLLSKSDYKLARTCPTKLYYKKRGYPTPGDEDPYLALLADGGYMVEHIAKLLFPEGRTLGYDRGSEEAARVTREALAAKRVTLIEATLLAGRRLARVDILVKSGNTFDLIEVKAKSWSSEKAAEGNPFRSGKDGSIHEHWREYLEDVTYQVCVLEALHPGAKVRPWLMLPDTSRTTHIDLLHRLFSVQRVQRPGAHLDTVEVTFTGDAARLRADHFLAKVDVGAEVDALRDEVREAAAEFEATLHPRLRRARTQLSSHCNGCEFRGDPEDSRDGFLDCWGDLGRVEPHLFELTNLGHVKQDDVPLADTLITEGKVSLYDVPLEALTRKDGSVGKRNQRQRLQIAHTRSGTVWIGEGLRAELAGHPYPLHFIDFETSALAVPYHAEMHPYEPVAFQWSCHTIAAPGAALEHAEWINTEDCFPSFAFARSLRARIGSSGTVFMWATHERTILRRIAEQLTARGENDPALAKWLGWIAGSEAKGRLIDMNQLTLDHFFHPRMKGQTSIKVVLPAVWESDAALRAEFPEYARTLAGRVLSPYETLPPIEIDGHVVAVREGTAAMRAYQEMLYGASRDDPGRRAAYRDLLLRYCRLDTAAMVVIWKHWRRLTGLPPG